MQINLQEVEWALNSFNRQTRLEAVRQLQHAIEQGEIIPPDPQPVCNLHAHTFFSYNAYGYSPSALAWLAKKKGIGLMGIVDFDTLGGVEEFLSACESLGVRGTASLETRVFLPEFSQHVINAPDEPGVAYHMITGFVSGSLPPQGQRILNELKNRVDSRNRRIVKILNPYLHPAGIDYEEDVLPLSAGGTPTERHILTAYITAVHNQIKDPVAFWADKLNHPKALIENIYQEKPSFIRLIRKSLIKAGGVAYQKPDEDSFPPLRQIHQLALAGNALPTAAWLDGTHTGEHREAELLEFLISKGVVALNIIPERNWHVEDPNEREIKTRNLYKVVALSRSLNLPIIVGTEMNKNGQKIVDNFNAAPLCPLRETFLDGAHFLYGHTLLSRYASLGYCSHWAQDQLTTRTAKNRFYTLIGKLVPPTPDAQCKVRKLPSEISPEDLITILSL